MVDGAQVMTDPLVLSRTFHKRHTNVLRLRQPEML